MPFVFTLFSLLCFLTFITIVLGWQNHNSVRVFNASGPELECSSRHVGVGFSIVAAAAAVVQCGAMRSTAFCSGRSISVDLWYLFQLFTPNNCKSPSGIGLVLLKSPFRLAVCGAYWSASDEFIIFTPEQLEGDDLDYTEGQSAGNKLFVIFSFSSLICLPLLRNIVASSSSLVCQKKSCTYHRN